MESTLYECELKERERGIQRKINYTNENLRNIKE
jgi:hypothetical protein